MEVQVAASLEAEVHPARPVQPQVFQGPVVPEQVRQVPQQAQQAQARVDAVHEVRGAVARPVLRVQALLVLPGAGVVVVAEVWTLRRAIPWSEASAASTLTANTPIMLLIRRLARAKADSSCRT